MADLRVVSIESERLRLMPTSVAYVDEIFAEFTAEVTAYMFPKPAEVIDETLAFLAGAQEEAGTWRIAAGGKFHEGDR